MPHFEVHGWWTVELRDDRARVLLAPTHAGPSMPPLLWVAAVRAHVPRADCFRVESTRTGFPHLVLDDAFGEVIASSPLFGHEADAIRTMQYVRNTVGTASVFHMPEAFPRMPSGDFPTVPRRVRASADRSPGLFSAVLDDIDLANANSVSSGNLDRARFRIHGSHFVTLEAELGCTLLRTRRLRGVPACLDAVVALRDLLKCGDRFDRYRTPYKGHAFAVRGAEREPLARSPVYSSDLACERAIALVRQLGPMAQLFDEPHSV